jgi:hypothetical protein
MIPGAILTNAKPLAQQENIGMHTVDMFLAINENGDAAVSLENASEARTTLVDEFGGEAIRALKVTVAVDLPEVTEVDVEVPAAAEDEPVEAEVEEADEEEEAEEEKEAA